MLLEKIKTPGLAHLSYLVGSGGKAAVIDPRRDCDIYVDMARRNGLEITHIFETHRNEDLISGAPILAEMTGARVLHGPNPEGPVTYAETAREGDSFAIGSLSIDVLETPGHTDDHLAFALYDTDYKDGAVGVFTGDALFIGDVGRTDFYPDRAREVAGLLYDSLQKILALGDQAIVYPAHGAGSVCGSGMAEREFSTLGHERRNNPRLNMDSRDAFIEAKLQETHYQPPYFRLMERLNLQGGAPAPRITRPRRLTLPEFEKLDADITLDIRHPLAFARAHFPGSVCIPADMIPAYAGWFIKEGQTLKLVSDTEDSLKAAMEHLTRIGLDNVKGGYVGLVPAAAKGLKLADIPMVSTADVKRRLQNTDDDWTLLDVRKIEEVETTKIDGSVHIFAGHLHKEYKTLGKSRSYTVMCASGMRATIAASWLTAHGFEKVDIYLGSMGAWQSGGG